MREKICVSIIVPFFNAECYIRRCLDVLLNQDFSKPFEIIMVDDGSTDNSRNIAKLHESSILQLYSLPSNAGPAAARNLGLKIAKGEYVFFLDVDDTIEPSTLTNLYEVAYETNCDLVICDKNRIENSKNQTANIFLYPSDQALGCTDLEDAMRRRYYDPITTMGLFGLTGRLIKHSIISDNNVLFEEKLRYWEDETFNWAIFAYVRSARYLRKKLYSYYVNPNVNSGVSDGFNKGFPVSNFKLTKNCIQDSLKKRGFSAKEIAKFGDQAFIYFIISALVSYSRSMILGKVDRENGVKCRRKLIEDILTDPDVMNAIRNYSPSKVESPWIPRAIAWRSRTLCEFACTRRAKGVLRIRRKGKA